MVSNFLTPSEIKRIQSLAGEQREVRFISLDPEKFAAQAVTRRCRGRGVLQEESGEVHDDRVRALAYGELRLDQVASQTVVTDKDLQDYYDKNKSLYVQPERRQASHILIETARTTRRP